MGCLYWATAIMAFLWNTLYTTLSMWNNFILRPAITSCLVHGNCSVPSDANVYKDEVLTVLAVYIIIPSAVFIELLVCILAVKYEFHDQRNLRHGGQCPSHKQCFLQSIHVLALWNILIAIQLLTKIATPICVFLFVHPQLTILYIIFLLMVPVSLTLIVAYLGLLYQCRQPRRRRVFCNAKHFGVMFVQLIVMIATLGLITVLVALYELMLLVQAQIGSGVTGLLLSLLPSFPLSALEWYLKTRSQKKARKSCNHEAPQLTAEEQLPEDAKPLPV